MNLKGVGLFDMNEHYQQRFRSCFSPSSSHLMIRCSSLPCMLLYVACASTYKVFQMIACLLILVLRYVCFIDVGRPSFCMYITLRMFHDHHIINSTHGPARSPHPHSPDLYMFSFAFHVITMSMVNCPLIVSFEPSAYVADHTFEYHPFR